MSELVLAEAVAADLAKIRVLQIESWRRAYRGLLSDEFLTGEVETVLAERWATMPGEGWSVIVARRGGRIAGFISVDRSRGPGAYVDNLHVAGPVQGLGVGRALMAAAAERLAGEGLPRLWLTVMRGNRAARAFYARLGGGEGQELHRLLYGQPVVSIPVEWLDLPRLAGLGPGNGATRKIPPGRVESRLTGPGG